MFHHKLYNGTQIWKHKDDQYKMENKKNKSNDTRIPYWMATHSRGFIF